MFASAMQSVASAVPRAWRTARVDRDDLDRFLFEAEDVVIVVGQDGLVADVAKYLEGQIVVGINPDPRANEGALSSASTRLTRPTCSPLPFHRDGLSRNVPWSRRCSTTGRSCSP